MKKVLLLAAVAAFVWSCSPDDDGPEMQYAVLDFEHAPIVAGPTAEGENLLSSFGGEKYTSYTDPATGLTIALNVDQGEAWSTGNPEFYSGGIAPSRWNDMQTGSYVNQCSVYYSGPGDNGGYNATPTFGIVFAPVTFDGTPQPAVMKFAAGVERQIEDMWVMNSTFMMLYDGGKDDFTLLVEGFDKDGVSTGIVDLEMAGIEEWTELELDTLGEINRLEMTIFCSDPMAPTYVCVDNVRVAIKK